MASQDSQAPKLQKESNASGDSPSDKIAIIQEKVNELYEFRDQYFEKHPIAEAGLKNKRLTGKLNETLKYINEVDSSTLPPACRAQYFYLLGRAHDVLEQHSPEAEAALTKAVKLDPQLVDAWNQLGECYWKRDNIKEAKNCFQGALKKKENKVSLRNLSILVRQEVASSSEERVANIETGLKLANQSVKLDITDAESWLVLGNSYLGHFFIIQQNPHTLHQAMSAYKQAEALPGGKDNSELHYNKATTLKFEEKYEEALSEYAHTIMLSPSWETPRTQCQQLIRYLDATVDLINSNGRLRAKKLASLYESIDEAQLGPYKDGAYTAPNGKSIKLQLKPLASLKEGLNENTVILGKVICSVRSDESVPFTFCLIDKRKTVAAVTVYNLAAGKGVIIGDSVAIPEPFLTNFSFSADKKKYSFTSLRVDNPIVMVVNGKKLGKDKLARMQLATFRTAH